MSNAGRTGLWVRLRRLLCRHDIHTFPASPPPTLIYCPGCGAIWEIDDAGNQSRFDI
jgi:hypothetical protein